MRYAAKADANQAEIVAALRGIGCSVVCTHTVGQGMPDLVVATPDGKRTVLMEIKDPKQPKHRHELTPAQKEFHAAWTGEIHIVFTVERALEVIAGRFF
ncbi:VRR-NUC domain-containing protein [Paraburkholderia bannensis]|uniref:VRR-NUC domain-containing protein n=1 Tax=Paraburkholderia bannensis TaxID=765414 RepID=UPI002AB65F41|nr:VRR-NUC domain-containing protein [Paraburkholderia bannensis]